MHDNLSLEPGELKIKHHIAKHD